MSLVQCVPVSDAEFAAPFGNPHPFKRLQVPESVPKSFCDRPAQSQIAQSQIGQSQDFWQLWETYRAALYRYCVRWMGNAIDAEDALSQAMLKAWEKLQKTTQITNPKAWLTRLVRNNCIDIWRQRGKHLMGSIDTAGAAETTIVATQETPDALLQRQELNLAMQRAIAALPTRLREPFMQRFCQEEDYRTIADRLGISYDTARKRIQEARAILQQQLRQYLTGEAADLFADEAVTDDDLQPVGDFAFQMRQPERDRPASAIVVPATSSQVLQVEPLGIQPQPEAAPVPLRSKTSHLSYSQAPTLLRLLDEPDRPKRDRIVSTLENRMATKVTVEADTFLKKRLLGSTDLSDSEKTPLIKGYKFEVSEYAPDRNQHLYFVLTEPILAKDGTSELKQVYAYAPHMTVEGNLNELIKLPVKYCCQLDNDEAVFGPGWRQCNTTSNTMLADYLLKGELSKSATEQGMPEPESVYMRVVGKYGDTTDHEAQTQALKELGIESYFSYSLSANDLLLSLKSEIPVVVGFSYKGSGHICLVVGHDPATNAWLVHDPYGTRHGASDAYDVGVGGSYDPYSQSVMQQIFWDQGGEAGWGRIVTSIKGKPTGLPTGL